MASHAGPEASEARTLQLGVYRHYIREFSGWLEDFLRVVADPVSAIKKRGISKRESTTLTVTLTMTSPPQMARLLELATRLQDVPEPDHLPAPAHHPQASNGPGILGTLGALAFGIGVTNAVMGKRHE